MHTVLTEEKSGREVYEIWFFPAYNYGMQKVTERHDFEEAVQLVNMLNGGRR